MFINLNVLTKKSVLKLCFTSLALVSFGACSRPGDQGSVKGTSSEDGKVYGIRDQFLNHKPMSETTGRMGTYQCQEFSAKMGDSSVTPVQISVSSGKVSIANNSGVTLRSGSIQNTAGIVPVPSTFGTGITEADVLHIGDVTNPGFGVVFYIEHIVRPAVAKPTAAVLAKFDQLQGQYETAISKDISGNSIPTLATSYTVCNANTSPGKWTCSGSDTLCRNENLKLYFLRFLNIVSRNWADAKAECDHGPNSSGWRLPTSLELQDAGSLGLFSEMSDRLRLGSSTDFWTSDECIGDSSCAYTVGSRQGVPYVLNKSSKSENHRVLCVHDIIGPVIF